MIVAGIGCRRNAPARDIDEVLRAAAGAHNIELRDVNALATEQSKAGEPGLVAAANALALPIIAITTEQLAAALPRVLTLSQRVAAAIGVPSVAEASALAAAGGNARLLGARHANPTATCAIAVSDQVSELRE